MDAVFLLVAVVLWLLMAGMAWGMRRLSRSDGEPR